jgi:hypothetical protein
MKKTVFLLAACAITSMLFAQVKVESNGDVNLRNTFKVENNKINVNSPTSFNSTTGSEISQFGESVSTEYTGNATGGFITRRRANQTYFSYAGEAGIYSNASRYKFLTSGLTTNASVTGLLLERNASSTGISAGVAGIDQTTSGTSASYGGYFNTLFAGGMHIAILRTTSTSIWLTREHSFIAHHGTSASTIYLPNSTQDRKPGKIYNIMRYNTISLTISGNGAQIFKGGTYVNSFTIPDSNVIVMLLWDGQYWIYGVMNR